MSTMTLAPRAIRTTGLITELSFLASGVLLLSAMAQVIIPLPFTPVPITGQTFAALLIGAGYGAARGLVTLTTYVLLGAMGAPVFAGQTGGLDVLTAPSAGYLLGMVVAAAVVGRVAERGWDRKPSSALASMLLGSAIIYAFGLAWLAMTLHVGLDKAFALGMLPFLIGDAVKITAAASLLPALWTLIDRKARRT